MTKIFVFNCTGSAPPNQPELGTVVVSPTKAEISFTVSSVAYDPESYAVMFGMSSDQLTEIGDTSSSTDTTSLTFLTDMNLMYTITVDGLNINQMYYYVILATNSISSASSIIGNFTTAEAREKVYSCLVEVMM